MGLVWAWARSELRRRWKATIVLVVPVGIVGGATMAGVSGARRTQTAMARFVASSRPFEVFLFNPEGAVEFEAVAGLPEVAVALVVPLTLALAKVVAAFPGRTATRIRPAVVLRAE